MTPAAAIITFSVLIAVVLGLLKSSWGALKRRKTYVVPDEQAWQTRTIRLRLPKKKNNKGMDQ